jgi:hypothetical protein
MSNFPKKQFQNVLYEFNHLAPTSHVVPLSATSTQTAHLHVAYSIHCFTEEFDLATHQDHHRYTYDGETRAFDVTRFQCSQRLPGIVANMARAKVYRALQNNYTYVAQVPVNGKASPYSMFFTLKSALSEELPSVRMYVQSAYIKPLSVGGSAQNWRFGSLLGQLSGVFEVSGKKQRPKKKAP